MGKGVYRYFHTSIVKSNIGCFQMPHHSTASWNSFVGRQRGDIENCRKKAFIALRKAARDSVPQELNFLPASTPNRAPGPSNSQSPVSKSDFQVITEFLADGGADNRTDDEVWATLADLVGTINFLLPLALTFLGSIILGQHQDGENIGNKVVQRSMLRSNG